MDVKDKIFVNEEIENDVMVIVGSKSNNGKSTIANIIARALVDHGIDPKIMLGVDHETDEDFYSEGKNLEQKVESIKSKGTNVLIKEVQFVRKL